MTPELTTPEKTAPEPTGRRSTRILISVIEMYRNMISPLRPPSCRFTPTCSQYAVDALRTYGLFRGTWLAAARLAKCGPWHRGGWDPVPEKTPEVDPGVTLRSDSFV